MPLLAKLSSVSSAGYFPREPTLHVQIELIPISPVRRRLLIRHHLRGYFPRIVHRVLPARHALQSGTGPQNRPVQIRLIVPRSHHIRPKLRVHIPCGRDFLHAASAKGFGRVHLFPGVFPGFSSSPEFTFLVDSSSCTTPVFLFWKGPGCCFFSWSAGSMRCSSNCLVWADLVFE